MVRESLPYFVHENSLYGYSFLIEPKELDEKSILDYLCEWTKGRDIKIYSHSLRRQDENFEKYSDIEKGGPDKNIPYCDWVYYLDIYWQ